MGTAELKSSIHTLVDGINDNSMLKIIYAILSRLGGYKNTRVVLSASEKKAVDEALKSVKKGDVHSHEKVMAEMKKKYPSLVK